MELPATSPYPATTAIAGRPASTGGMASNPGRPAASLGRVSPVYAIRAVPERYLVLAEWQGSPDPLSMLKAALSWGWCNRPLHW
jgi:hypothetical protein